MSLHKARLKYASVWMAVVVAVSLVQSAAVEAAGGTPDTDLAPVETYQTARTQDTQKAGRWRLTFQDVFTTRGLDRGKWSYRALGDRQRDSDRLCSESSRKSVRVPGDGYVYLRIHRIPRRHKEFGPRRCPDGEWYNANIGTQGKYAFRYGKMAMRAKFQHQRGQHGAFWSQPDSRRRGGAEIDVVEYFGDGYPKGGLGHYAYCKGVKRGGIIDSRDLIPPRKTWSNSFHVFSVRWTPSRYIFQIDGHPVWRLSRCVSRVRQYLILSLLTSGWELPQLDASNLNAMKVDWVRVWQR